MALCIFLSLFLLAFHDTFCFSPTAARACECRVINLCRMISPCRLFLFVVLGRCYQAAEAADRAAGPGQRIMLKASNGEEKLIDVSRVAGGGFHSCGGGSGGGGSEVFEPT